MTLMQTMVNEKFRENVPAWTGFSAHMGKFPAFFGRVVRLQSSARAWQTHERVTYLLFFIHAFQSLEQEAVRAQALKLVSLPLWYSLSRGRLQVTHALHPHLCKRRKLLMCCVAHLAVWLSCSGDAPEDIRWICDSSGAAACSMQRALVDGILFNARRSFFLSSVLPHGQPE